MQEALITQKVYFFYDNFQNGGANWNHYDVVFGFSGIQKDGSGSNNYYSNPPYSVFGSISNLFSTPIESPSEYEYNITHGYSNNYWGLYPNGTSGGYSIGVTYSVNNWSIGDNIITSSGCYELETNSISIANGNAITLEFYSSFQLSLGGEGVIVFISHDNGKNWHWLPPLQGYPGNINDGCLPTALDSRNFLYPHGGGLVPAFTGTSSGWNYYKFNLSDAYNQAKNPVSEWQNLKILLIFGYDSGYFGNIYGNDNFYIDDLRVTEIGQIKPNSDAVNSGTIGDTWSLDTISYNGTTYTGFNNILAYSSNNINYDEIDNLISIPISLSNAISANMNFLTQFKIYARYSYPTIASDDPTGFSFYIGIITYNGIVWHQMNTRWSGEAGYSISSYASSYVPYLMNASQIVSAYYASEKSNEITYEGAFQTNTYSVINLTGYVGQTILIKFVANGDNSSYYLNQTMANGVPEFSYKGASEPQPPYYIFVTDVVVQGYSLYSPIQVQTVWT